jgi:glutathione S-transferase
VAHTLKLISFDLCPFVERSRIVLIEKAVPYELELIDLRNKPPWFLAISPMGKVPVLVCDGQAIFESMVINELLEELYPTPRLFPTEPLQRAQARGWIVFANDALMPAGHQAMKALAEARGGQSPTLAESLAPLRRSFETLEGVFAQRESRFFLGDQLGLVDAAYAPFLRRWSAAVRWTETRLLPSFPRLSRYTDALLAHPSVAGADPGNVGPRLQTLYQEIAHRKPASTA